MSVSKDTVLNGTTKALKKQVEYNDLRYLKKGESSGYADLNITVGEVAPDSGIWFDTSNKLDTGGESDE